MTREEYDAVNSLLALLWCFQAVDRMDQHYRGYGNDAPGDLVKASVEKVEALLGKHRRETTEEDVVSREMKEGDV